MEVNSLILDIVRIARLSSLKLSKKEMEAAVKKVLPQIDEKLLDKTLKTALQIIEAMRLLENHFPKNLIDIHQLDEVSITAPFRDEILEIALDELNLERSKGSKQQAKILPMKRV